jgi:hypothetical protein
MCALAGLDCDLSCLHEDLKCQDIRTSDKLFTLMHWPEDQLHQMFKEAIPSMMTPQCFILVAGLLEYGHRK